MIKNTYDFVMLSAVGILKVSIFFLFIFLAVFIFVKSKDYKREKPHTLSSFINKSGIGENIDIESLVGFEDIEDVLIQTDEPGIEDITPEEAEIFLFILRYSNSISPANALKLANLIVEECDSYKLDPYLILAVIKVESEFSPAAVSHQGAIGLMQVMPRTGRYVAEELGIDYKGKSTLYDPFINVKLGIHYLSFLNDRFDNTEEALAAYNYGPAKIAKIRKWRTKPRYVRKVLDFADYLKKESIILAKAI